MRALLQTAAISSARFRSQSSFAPTVRPPCSIRPASSPFPVTAKSRPAQQTRWTVIRFSVRVPVLSEQMTLAQPSVSTACRRRMTAFFLTIRLTDSARAMVTMAGRPSGMAATASEMPVMSISSTGSPRRMPAPATTAQISRQPTAMVRPSWSSFFCSGVCSSSIESSITAICPMRVSSPMA